MAIQDVSGFPNTIPIVLNAVYSMLQVKEEEPIQNEAIWKPENITSLLLFIPNDLKGKPIKLKAVERSIAMTGDPSLAERIRMFSLS